MDSEARSTDQSGLERRLQGLLDVGRALVSELDLDLVLEHVLEAARELTGARYAALGVLDESRRGLERFVTAGIDEETHRSIGELPRGRGVLGVLITDPRPLRLTDVGQHPRSYGFPPGHPPMRSFLGVPVVVRGEVYGNLYLTEKRGGDFDDDDEQALVILAEWAAIAIDNARSYAIAESRRVELERAFTSLEATTAIAQALAGETDLGYVLELIVKRGRALTEARSMVALLERGGELVVTAVAGELDPDLVGERIPVEGSVAGDVLRSGRAERLADASSRRRFALEKQTGARTGLFVPMRFRGRVLGVLAAFDRLRAGPEFSVRDEEAMGGFAASAAAAVATAQDVAEQALHRSVAAAEQERARWARELHDETLQELAALKMLLASARRTDDAGQRQAMLEQAAERIDVAVRALRGLITDLRPAALDELGLEPALEALASRVTQSSGLAVELTVDFAFDSGRESSRLASELEDAIYRIVQEALANVVKHAGASHVSVAVRESAEAVEVEIRDDGAGFDPAQAAGGFGLVGMRERAGMFGGSITVESGPAAGTAVRLALPVARAGQRGFSHGA